MADLTAEQARVVKATTNNIETGYQALRKASANIQTLLYAGQATCDDLKAYNLWALAIYGTQQTMLATLRATGVSAPQSIAYPTLFTWKGVPGAQAWQINCNPSTNTLSGALAAAMAPVSPTSQFVDPKMITVIHAQPENQGALPSYGQLIQQNGALGIFGIDDLFIAGIVIAVIAASAAIVALASYFKEKDIQEETTKRNAIQLQAYQSYTEQRAACYTKCVAIAGNSAEGCTTQCARLVPAPQIVTDAARGVATSGLGILGTIGLIALAAVGGVAAVHYYKTRYGGNHEPRILTTHDE